MRLNPVTVNARDAVVLGCRCTREMTNAVVLTPAMLRDHCQQSPGPDLESVYSYPTNKTVKLAIDHR